MEKAWKLEILSGSYMPPFFLRTSLMNLPRSLSRAAAGIFVTLKIFSQPFTLFPSYLVFFIVFDDLSAAMKSDSLVLDSSNLRRTRLSLYFACFPPNTLRNQIGISAAECCFSITLTCFSFQCIFFNILAFIKSWPYSEIGPAKLTNNGTRTNGEIQLEHSSRVK